MIVTDDALWAGHPASRTLTRLKLPDGRRVWQTEIDCQPMMLARSQARLFASCWDTGELVVLDERNGNEQARAWVGHGPFGVLASGERVYVTLAHEDALLALRADPLTEIGRVSTGRQPRGLAMKGNRLYVVHLLDASVRVFDARTMESQGEIQVGLQGALAESVTLHPERERAYIPHQRQNVTNMGLTFDSTVFPVVSALDTEEMHRIRRESLTLDTVDTPVGLPVVARLNPDGELMYVVNAASDDISVVDLALYKGVGHVVVGHNPRDLVLSPDSTRLYTLNLVSDDISVVDTETLEVVKTFDLAEDPRPAAVQRGERIFFTSRPDVIARDNWIACASCHFDGGFDAQTWLGAEGGPRNTPVLRGIRGTEPLHWSADRPDVQSFQQTITNRMGGTGLLDADLDALAEYVNSLEPLPSPRRAKNGLMTEEAILGIEVFQRARCSACHTPPVFTDREVHDVRTGEGFHEHPSRVGTVAETLGPEFDTPSLRELWLTAPYLHDGRAPTLRNLLTTLNHGDAAGLSDAELAALEAFLLTLPLTQEELADLFGGPHG